MVKKSTSAAIFIIDLLIMYTCFWGVYTQPRIHPYFSGYSHVVGIYWSCLVHYSGQFVTNVNIESMTIRVLKDTLIGYSVLSASVIGLVAVFGEFAPNNKLILWPMLFAFSLSLLLRLITIKHFVRQGYQQKAVLIIGGGSGL